MKQLTEQECQSMGSENVTKCNIYEWLKFAGGKLVRDSKMQTSLPDK